MFVEGGSFPFELLVNQPLLVVGVELFSDDKICKMMKFDELYVDLAISRIVVSIHSKRVLVLSSTAVSDSDVLSFV